MHLNSRPALLTAAFLLVLCTACDRLTKHAALALRERPPVVLAGGVMTLTYAENSGAVLSLGAGLPENVRFMIFTTGVGALLACVAGVLLFSGAVSRHLTVPLSLILAGGANNLFDRLSNDGRVVDFMTLGAGTVRTGIFNLADVAIMLGAFLMLYTFLRQWKPHDR
jgi:signal peptidase II